MVRLGLTSLVLPLYQRYNAGKEEEARRRGYTGSNQTQIDGERKRVNTRVVLSRCIYGMYYRHRRHVLQTQEACITDTEVKSWWQDLHYDLVSNEDVLHDDSQHYRKELDEEKSNLYFGALRRTKNYPQHLNDHDAPEWIIAVRGTEISYTPDVKKDAELFLETLRVTDFKLLYAVVARLIGDYGCENVVLTGHSLGAAGAMLVGRQLAEEGKLVQAHLFNPPFATLTEFVRKVTSLVAYPLRSDIAARLNARAMEVADFITFAVNFLADRTDLKLPLAAETADSIRIRGKFRSMGRWTPHLYVHRHDVISKQYIEHFENFWHHIQKMAGVETINKPEDAFHILPRAMLHTTSELASSLPSGLDAFRPISAHMLWNWASPELACEIKEVNLDKKN